MWKTCTIPDRRRRSVFGTLLCLVLAALAMAAPLPAAAPAADFTVRTVLAPDRPLGPGDYLWEAAGVPAGQIRIVVDLEAETLYVYRAGVEIGRSYIIYGADDKPTPTGSFPILQKRVEHYSNLYDNAPMPYMLRLTWDGVAIHGSDVDYGNATHGCIGVPEEFAQLLFREARVGDRVIVTRGWMRNRYGP